MARNAVWLALGEGAVKSSLFVSAAIIARAAGPEGMGVFTIAYAAALLAVMVLAVGQQEVLIREVAGTPSAAADFLAASRTVQRRLAAGAVPLLAAGALAVDDSGLRAALLAFIPYALLRTALITTGAAFKGLDRMDVEVRARAIEVGVVLPLLAAGAWFHLPVWTTGLVFALGSGVGLIWIRFRSRELDAEPGGSSAGHPPAVDWRRTFLIEGLPFLGLAFVSQLLARADTFLLAGWNVPQAEIGYYGAAGAPVWGMAALPTLLAVAAYPTLSRRAAEGRSAVGPVVAAVTGGAASGAIVAALIFIFRSPLISIAYGSKYEASVALLGRLVWVLPAKFAMTFLGLTLASWRRQRRALAALVAVLAVSVALNIRWIPSDGALGSATAAVAAHTLGVLLLAAMALTIPRSNGNAS